MVEIYFLRRMSPLSGRAKSARKNGHILVTADLKVLHPTRATLSGIRFLSKEHLLHENFTSRSIPLSRFSDPCHVGRLQ
jgi:hypothetical protein